MALTHLHACRVDKIILKLPRKTKEVIKGRINLLEVSLHKLPLHAVETSREASLQCLDTVTGATASYLVNGCFPGRCRKMCKISKREKSLFQSTCPLQSLPAQ